MPQFDCAETSGIQSRQEERVSFIEQRKVKYNSFQPFFFPISYLKEIIRLILSSLKESSVLKLESVSGAREREHTAD